MENKSPRERSSAVRNKILQILMQKKQALAHKDFQLILEDFCDRVTIYRALDKLHDDGKIHKINGTDGVIQYAICNGCQEKHHHDHIHFNCLKCKKVSCLESKPVISLPEGYQLQEIQCLVSGICPQCANL